MSLRHFILTLCFIPVFSRRYGHGSGYGGQRVSYPSGNGLSGTSHRGGYLSGGGHYGTNTYSRGGGYPPNGGMSGTGGAATGRTSYRTEIHHHHYAPPQHISYGAVQHPVYHGTPPVYVMQYRDSGSRFDTLLTGLALYNLGRMSAHQDGYRRYGSEYRGSPGEVCKLAIDRPGAYEETRVDCRLMSSFIWDADRPAALGSRTVVSQTVITNDTVVQSSTVVDALQAKGPSLRVSPGTDCFMIQVSRDTTQLRRRVDCALLQEYALRSYNNCESLKSLPFLLMSCIVFLCFK